MSSSVPDHRQRQAGFSASGTLVLLIVVAFLLKVAVVIVPAYYDHYMIGNIATQLLKDVASQDIGGDKLCSDLTARFDINHVTVPIDHFQCTHDDQGYGISEDYEIRKNFVGNLDVVMHFSHNFASQSGAGKH